MTDMAKKILLAIVAVIAVVVAICWLWPNGKTDEGQGGGAGQLPILSTEQMLANANKESQSSGIVILPIGETITPPRGEKTRTSLGPDAATALKLYQHGQKLADDGKLVEARTVLSKALFSATLPTAEAAKARKLSTDLAENTLFSPAFNPNDPYLLRYTVKTGDRLALVERQLKLHVPIQIICKINRLDDPNRIRMGQTLKMIKGPFHAVVDLSNFTMDIYLHREGLPYVFIKRMRTGLGKKGVTPTGSWRVGLGRKMIKPPWNAPANSDKKGTILYGQPGYPFGKKGLWIGLEGTDQKTRLLKGYGLHSTDEPNSIGRQVSLGCIRLRDGDMELAFSLLYETWSTVIIKK